MLTPAGEPLQSTSAKTLVNDQSGLIFAKSPRWVGKKLLFLDIHEMIVTPDNRTLIVAETLAHRLTAFEIDNDGSLGNRRLWAQFQDEVKPDGICLDREGAIWVAGAVFYALHVREGGEVDQQISTSRPVFATMLGGPERKHLFICTSSSPDPVITRRTPSATIDIVEVDTPGVEFPSGGP